ncbi:hypothetical protein ACFW04_014568 [Cataglyphis niger]
MDYYSMYLELQNGGSWGGGIPRVFFGSPYQRDHDKQGVRGKKLNVPAINIIDDIKNNMPFKIAVKHRFEKSRDNLKKKAKEKISKFVIPSHGEEYLDLTHTMLSLRVRVETSGDSTGHIMGAGGSASTDNVGSVNHLLHFIFNQIDVYFNQKLASPLDNAYAYRVYIEALLNYSSPGKTSHLISYLWDVITIMMFSIKKFLTNGVEVRLKLVRSKDLFCLMDSNGTPSKIHILDASLLVRRAKINAGLLLAHARILSKIILL